MKFLLTFTLLIGCCASTLPKGSCAQEPTNLESETTREVRIEGLVTERKKYSFKIRQGATEYDVKLSSGAPIGLKMNKPWYDWKNDQVVVDSVVFPNNAQSKSNKRVAVKLPPGPLFLISRFSDSKHMTQIMSANVKRLNFYLITPENQGQHLPTQERPYIAGSLRIQKNQQVRLEIAEQSLPVRLGFRYATMNGFSIMQLEPNKTQVFIAGVPGSNENEILASRVLFQPVEMVESTDKEVSQK